MSAKDALERERKPLCLCDFVLLKGCGRLSESALARGLALCSDVSGVRIPGLPLCAFCGVTAATAKPGLARTLPTHAETVVVGDIEAIDANEGD